MNLVIDIGNTFSKIFVFERNKLVHFHQTKTGEKIGEKDYLFQIKDINQAIISSVADIPEFLINAVGQISSKTIILDYQTPIPVKNLYRTPESLGKDRIAAIVGAYNIYRQQNVLVIDAGTAITFDLINKQAEYLGGNISPGLDMRYKALNHYTNKLPLLEKQENSPFWGTSTDEAITAGVQNGIIFEIEAYIDRLNQRYSDLKVILTGGDTFFIAHKIERFIFTEPNLVAIGLNGILHYNEGRL